MAASKRLMFPAAAAIVAIGAGGWYALRFDRPRRRFAACLRQHRGHRGRHQFQDPRPRRQALRGRGRTGLRRQAGGPIGNGRPASRRGPARAQLQAAQAALAELLAGSRPDEIAAALAAMQKAQANYSELKNGSRPEEISASEAEFHAAEADRDHLKRDLDRDELLRRTDPGTIAAEQVDRAYAAYRMANERYLEAMKRYELVKIGPRQEEIAQAKAAMEQAQAQYRLVKEGPRKEDIDQARAKVEQAKASLQAAERSSVTPS